MATKQVTGNCTVTVSTSYTGYTVSIPNNWGWYHDSEGPYLHRYQGGNIACGPYTITYLEVDTAYSYLVINSNAANKSVTIVTNKATFNGTTNSNGSFTCSYAPYEVSTITQVTIR